MVKRNNLEIMAEILRLCKAPKSKTQVMYGANLSWRMLHKYLSELKDRGFLEVRSSRTRYLTTQKGREFVKRWTELAELL